MYTVRQPRRALPRAAAVASLGCAVLVFGSAAPAPAATEAFVAGSGDAVANVGRVVARASGLPLATASPLPGTNAPSAGAGAGRITSTAQPRLTTAAARAQDPLG